ncbi:acyltransferase family protein [Lacicoccus alkaliphilus]|uniref:Peptidoglycan/LPS O-acetylase OafA/YrhL, contains acyltransferase and SGNH-hydrolase domains n=1 Tax=Lacicoccus alkaliphilus DSM 16010 TaxID=1123231 RepID=A0A1M7D1A3_9BACL|nr:acyltransferase family protein [Salinicoccus alkaliphilus]SHL73147.1 Peptidoglycan/LPS O-acetylase OafA/YrhL, contains acyltransferase and SGNH-hydrolase domains [Salinicoccus alkaliphilus DSM 16010]
MDLYKVPERKYRPEIEGVRAVAAILIAIYHIWLGNVSGGVDVFFVVSGFLITASLLGMYERTGGIDVTGYLLKLGKRLFPTAFTVLLFILVTSFLFLPQSQWAGTVREIIAALFYVENWMLAFNSVDYLAQNNVASPVQHFWAMSTQFQFYMIWTAVLIIAVFIAKRLNIAPRKSLFIILITMFIASFGYSVYITTVNQPWAYFDTFARVWEFATGGILFLVIGNIVLNKSMSFIFGWIGFIGLISCGLILQVSTVFPGYAALWPVASAVLILLAGNNGGKLSVYQILGSKPLVKFGSISYGFYLWHWPLLILYYNITGNASASIVDGVSIILIAVVLSYLTTHIVEKPIRDRKVMSKPKTALLLVGIASPIIILAGVWNHHINELQNGVASAAYSDPGDHPGAMVFAPGVEADPDVDYLPQLIHVKDDLPRSYADGCHQHVEKSDVIQCEYGETENPDRTIALVGGSHSTHWLPALEVYAQESNTRIVNYTKSVCRFSAESYLMTTPAAQRTCEEWVGNVTKELVEEQPDLVFTTADATEWEGLPEGYAEKWAELEEEGVKVFAIKDNPRVEYDIPGCVEQYGEDNEGCYLENDLEDFTDEIDQLDLSNVYYADLTDKFCEDDVCKPIIGNVLVYRDDHHITKTYSETLAPFVGEEIEKALEYFEE